MTQGLHFHFYNWDHKLFNVICLQEILYFFRQLFKCSFQLVWYVIIIIMAIIVIMVIAVIILFIIKDVILIVVIRVVRPVTVCCYDTFLKVPSNDIITITITAHKGLALAAVQSRYGQLQNFQVFHLLCFL